MASLIVLNLFFAFIAFILLGKGSTGYIVAAYFANAFFCWLLGYGRYSGATAVASALAGAAAIVGIIATAAGVFAYVGALWFVLFANACAGFIVLVIRHEFEGAGRWASLRNVLCPRGAAAGLGGLMRWLRVIKWVNIAIGVTFAATSVVFYRYSEGMSESYLNVWAEILVTQAFITSIELQERKWWPADDIVPPHRESR